MFFNVTDADVNGAVIALRTALQINLGDHFAFDVTRIAPLQQETKGARVHVNARLGPDFEAAVGLAGQIFDPILTRTATGSWNPSTRDWTRHE